MIIGCWCASSKSSLLYPSYYHGANKAERGRHNTLLKSEMDSLNSVATALRTYDRCRYDLYKIDDQLWSSTGATQLQLARQKTELLSQMLRICLTHGFSDYARQCECSIASHFANFPGLSVGTALSPTVASSFPASRHAVARSFAGEPVSDNGSNIINSEYRGKGRLANVAPRTPDQVNDKKVAEKCFQVHKAYAQLEKMTTPVGEDRKKFPRFNSFIVSVSECNPNSGGGNRTKPDSAEGKRRDRTLVVIRSMDGSMLRDGTLRRALSAGVEKLNSWDSAWAGDFCDGIQQQERFDVEGAHFNVAVALSWENYHQHLFTDNLVPAHKKRTGRSNGTRTNSAASLDIAEERAAVSSTVPAATLALPSLSSLPPISGWVPHSAASGSGMMYGGVLPAGTYSSGIGEAGSSIYAMHLLPTETRQQQAKEGEETAHEAS